MIILHQYRMSPFNMKVQRMLNYKGVPFEEKYYRLMDRKEIGKISPSNKLPALEHNGQLIVDSTDMAWYIEETWPDKPMIPDNPRQRGLMHALEDWADESLYFYEMRWRFATPGNSERNVPRMLENEKPLARWFLNKVLAKGLGKILDNQGTGRKSMEQLSIDTRRHVQAVTDLLVEDEWLLGEQISLADTAVHTMLDCFMDADEARSIVEEQPSVVAWMQRLEAATDTRA